MTEAPYVPDERRPIAARTWPVFGRLTTRLVRLGVSADAVSLTGMACGLAAGGAFALTAVAGDEVAVRGARLAAAALIQGRLLANLLDGMVAIESGRASRVGELYNDVPDRVSDTAILVGAGCAAGQVVLGCAAACAALFTAYVRVMGKAAGASQHYCGPMAKQHRMAVLTATALLDGLLPASLQPTWVGGWTAAALGPILVGCLVTAVRRLRRIAAELRGKSP